MNLRLLSYNIQRGIHLQELLRVFGTVPAFAAADVIAIQEASFLPDGQNVLGALAAALSPDHVWTYHPVMTYPDKEYGNGFLFRGELEVLGSCSVLLPQVDRLRWYEKQKTEGGVPDTKSAFVQTFAIAGRPLTIANVHLDFAGGPRHRNGQLQHLLRTIEGRRGQAVDVICGDFNTVGHYRWPETPSNIATAMDCALSRDFVDLTRNVPYTSDLFGSIDPADPAARILRLGRRLGFHFRQKTDHILVRGMVGGAKAGYAFEKEQDLLRISDHLPLEAALSV